MCQAHEEYGGCGGEEPPRVSRVSCAKKCMKCKEGSPVLIIRLGDAFCKACFKEYFVHKFRAMLGKNRCIYPGEKVLLAFSGGPASSSMVRQVQEGLSRDAAKKLRFVPGIIYVDEGAVCGRSRDEREEKLAQVESIPRALGFPYHLVRLEEVFELPGSILCCVSHNPPGPKHSYKEAVDNFIQRQHRQGKAGGVGASLPEKLAELSVLDSPRKEETDAAPGAGPPAAAARTEELVQLFAAVKTLTAKEELLQNLRNHLILHTARTHGYTKVMMGDSCTRLAVKLLTNLALGRGAFLAMDTGFSDDRHGDTLVLRPMREYSAKEIAFYNRLFGVPTVFTPALDTKAPEKGSIHRLMESFLYRLQAEFPSTVSTVYRTGEKLSAAPRDAIPGCSSDPELCLLCLCALDTNVEEGSVLQATLRSEQLCQKRPSPARNDCCMGCQERTGCCRDTAVPGTAAHAALLPLLCYSCRLTVKDMRCPGSLPAYIQTEADRRRRRAEMKQEIQEFLLEEDDGSSPDPS
uniref:Cytoplasmic tRNA 2-thiolation protein 2 n=1 Tax=Sphenodon punctatus TaxID=8508 RepID=A0A8D0GQK7_SPHPU